jgi:N,N-dimethylformamidase
MSEKASVNRRDFLKTVGATTLATSVLSRADAEAQAAREAAAPPPDGGASYSPIPEEVAENLRKRGIVGYADRLGVSPGETIRFMVSSESDRYQAQIVRLIHGDPNPEGPGVKEIEIATPVTGEYPGKRQDLPMGSHGIVPDHADLRLSGSFTITAWIAPTTVHPRPAEGIVTKWSEADRTGYGLFIEEDGTLALRIGGETLPAGAPLRPWVPAIPGMNERAQGVSTQWTFVAAAFDASSRKALLYQQPQNRFPFDSTRSVVERQTAATSVPANAEPLRMAAYSGRGKVSGHYNGKIDNPRLYARALDRREIEEIENGRGPEDFLASWDFSRDIETNKISDTSRRGLHGQVVNFPMRAVTGHNWNSSELDFRKGREQYGAIYFHDDDLEDALWDVGFELAVPADFRSGLYAARLRTVSGEDYVPFVVRPGKSAPRSKVALVIPTFSYLAYAGTGTSAIRPLSLYSRHSDGSGVCYSSRLRPITNMRPKIDTRNPWQFMADTHLVDWLEVKGFEVDFLTDEDLHFGGAAALSPYRVVLTGTHPEYYSLEMLEGLRSYLEGGGRLMYMGGNGFYWVTPMDESGKFIEVRRRDGTEHWQGAPGEHHHSLTGEPGGLWRFRGMAPQQFFGVGFTAQGFDRNSPFRRTPGSFDPRARFIFEGIGENELIGNHPSLVLSFGAAGSELDRADYALGTPAHTLVLASSFGHSDEYRHVVEQTNTANWAKTGGTENPLVRADMVYLEYPKGGGVFSTSSIAWCGSLSFNHYENNVSRITENVLRRFAADEPLPSPAGAISTSAGRAERVPEREALGVGPSALNEE